MIMSRIAYLTEQGLQNLRQELNHLVTKERPQISKQIAEARDKGDLSENAEYEAAKEAQALLEMKIGKLEETIKNSRLIDQSKLNKNKNKIQILSKVKLKNLKNEALMEYMIVSESEANLKSGKISINTPIAKGLLGKKKGEKVDIKVPSGMMSFEIMDISA